MPDRTARPPEPPEKGSIRCANNHAQYRYEEEPCEGHGAHYIYTCPMRYGGDVCGEVTTWPEVNANCEPGKGEQQGQEQGDAAQ